MAEAEGYLERGDFSEALALAGKRLVLLPGDPDALIVRCRALLGLGRGDEALEAVSGLEGLLRSLSLLFGAMAEHFSRRGRAEQAHRFSSLAEALGGEVPPSPPEEQPEGEVPADFQTVTLARLYVRQGHLDLAAGILEEIMRRDPDDEEAATLLAEVRRMSNPDAAVIGELERWLANIGRLRGYVQ